MADLAQELHDARAREAATSEILRVINRSPNDYRPVFDAILEHATRLCDASLGLLFLREDDGYRFVAGRGLRPESSERLRDQILPLDPELSATAKAAAEGRPIEVLDVTDQSSHGAGQPMRRLVVEVEGIRTQLTVPMLRGDEAVGVILVYRREVRGFEPNHVELLTTFAEQAVIAVDNVRRFRALQESLERQTATSDILRTISRSPTDYGPVFDAILGSATRLCDAPLGILLIRHGDYFKVVAHRGTRPEFVEWLDSNPVPTNATQSFSVRAATEGVPLHLRDMTDTEGYRDGMPHAVAGVRIEGIRTALFVPMMKGNDSVGVIAIYRREVRPFDESHTALVSTFADQAVIAIDNVRLFQALEARTDELGEALERQTATSDILRTISRSPTDYGPVFDTILENAVRLCEAPLAFLMMREGDQLVLAAHKGSRPEFVEWFMANPMPIDSPLLGARVAAQGIPMQVADITDFENYRHHRLPHAMVAADIEDIRTMLCVPMMKGDESVGVVAVYRREVRPFSESHIALVTTFADQAVIAIDNVRLFQALEARTDELGGALERQTATSDILRTISRSPTDYGPVFDAILDSATRLCDAPLAFLMMREQDQFNLVAHKGSRPEFVEWTTANPIPVDAPLLLARAAAEGVSYQLADIKDTQEYRDGMLTHRVAAADLEGIRSTLFVPMMKGDDCVGVIAVYRREVREFHESHIALVSTFADQAVIAIDNVRLFQALEARTDELGEALERQTATSDILRTISRSPTDYGPVFDAILESATRLCNAPLAFLLMREGDHFNFVAHRGSRAEYVEWVRSNPVPIRDGKTLAARAAIEGVPQQLADITDSEDYRNGNPHRVASAEIEGIRTSLFVPMMKGDDCVGVIAVYRREVREFDESHIALVSTFADQAVIAIDNVRLFQALDERTRALARSVEELRALGEIGQTVNSTLDPETVLDTIITQAVALTDTYGGVIAEYDEVTGTLWPRAAPGLADLLGQEVRLGEGAIGRAAETRAAVQIPDVDAPGAYTERLRPLMSRAGLRALLAVPLLREDRVLGALLVARQTPGEFPPGTVELLGTFAAQSALAIHNARLFREIEEQGRELARANQHKSEFLANMSHELRTPLNAVIGFSEVLGEEMFGELNEKQKEYVGDIHSSGRHLLSLINDILDLSKIEAGRMELDLTTFDVRQALANALTLVSERAGRRGIALESDIDESLTDMTGDERKVKQILLNLLSNAVKFTSAGGRVTLTARGVDSMLVIAVRDTGVGIAADDLEHIFEEFRQVGTDYARKVEGTGLGLTLTRRFVELHGGEITVESEPGVGSEFRITLPLAPPAAAVAGSDGG